MKRKVLKLAARSADAGQGVSRTFGFGGHSCSVASPADIDIISSIHHIPVSEMFSGFLPSAGSRLFGETAGVMPSGRGAKDGREQDRFPEAMTLQDIMWRDEVMHAHVAQAHPATSTSLRHSLRCIENLKLTHNRI